MWAKKVLLLGERNSVQALLLASCPKFTCSFLIILVTKLAQPGYCNISQGIRCRHLYRCHTDVCLERHRLSVPRRKQHSSWTQGASTIQWANLSFCLETALPAVPQNRQRAAQSVLSSLCGPSTHAGRILDIATIRLGLPCHEEALAGSPPDP